MRSTMVVLPILSEWSGNNYDQVVAEVIGYYEKRSY